MAAQPSQTGRGHPCWGGLGWGDWGKWCLVGSAPREEGPGTSHCEFWKHRAGLKQKKCLDGKNVGKAS